MSMEKWVLLKAKCITHNALRRGERASRKVGVNSYINKVASYTNTTQCNSILPQSETYTNMVIEIWKIQLKEKSVFKRLDFKQEELIRVCVGSLEVGTYWCPKWACKTHHQPLHRFDDYCDVL